MAIILMIYLFSFYTNVSSVSVESLQLIAAQFLTFLTISAELLKTLIKDTFTNNFLQLVQNFKNPDLRYFYKLFPTISAGL